MTEKWCECSGEYVDSGYGLRGAYREKLCWFHKLRTNTDRLHSDAWQSHFVVRKDQNDDKKALFTVKAYEEMKRDLRREREQLVKQIDTWQSRCDRLSQLEQEKQVQTALSRSLDATVRQAKASSRQQKRKFEEMEQIAAAWKKPKTVALIDDDNSTEDHEKDDRVEKEWLVDPQTFQPIKSIEH